MNDKINKSLPSSDQLIVSEIYLSLQGESTLAGLPCVVVRLVGCNLECSWCDTLHAREETGTVMTISEILAKVESLGCKRVELTGGEPLMQPASADLLTEFCQAGYQTMIETNGSYDISKIDPRIKRIVDIKCPDSLMQNHNLISNLDILTANDEVKCVIASRKDFDFAVELVNSCDLLKKCSVIFSPVWDKATPAELSDWILESKLDIRLGLQLHKIIWPEIDRGV